MKAALVALAGLLALAQLGLSHPIAEEENARDPRQSVTTSQRHHPGGSLHPGRFHGPWRPGFYPGRHRYPYPPRPFYPYPRPHYPYPRPHYPYPHRPYHNYGPLNFVGDILHGVGHLVGNRRRLHSQSGGRPVTSRFRRSVLGEDFDAEVSVLLKQVNTFLGKTVTGFFKDVVKNLDELRQLDCEYDEEGVKRTDQDQQMSPVEEVALGSLDQLTEGVVYNVELPEAVEEAPEPEHEAEEKSESPAVPDLEIFIDGLDEIDEFPEPIVYLGMLEIEEDEAQPTIEATKVMFEGDEEPTDLMEEEEVEEDSEEDLTEKLLDLPEEEEDSDEDLLEEEVKEKDLSLADAQEELDSSSDSENAFFDLHEASFDKLFKEAIEAESSGKVTLL